jgi:mRNA-degrading endonuclease YafQ of YafQ-DinJ toxin-antitoxin module
MKVAEVTYSIIESIKQHLDDNTIIWSDYSNALFESETTHVKTSQCFNKANKKYIKNSRVQSALKNFLVTKASDKRTPFGSKDYPMTGKGPLSGIKHAGLTNDISIMYEIKNNTIYLFAIGSHDELGFGRPNNINKQKSLVKKINSFCNTENI